MDKTLKKQHDPFFDDIPQNWHPRLIPVRDKAPYGENWKTRHYSQSQLQAELVSDKATGLGLRTGNGFLVVDIDGLTAKAELRNLEINSGQNWLPVTVSWSSGRVDREDLLFTIPDAYKAKFEQFTIWKRNGLEIRYNNHQNVIPPSKHPETDGYYWINSPKNHKIAELPAKVCDYILSLINNGKTEDNVINSDNSSIISHDWGNSDKFPLYMALPIKDRDLIDQGTSEGNRHHAGIRLGINLWSTAKRLNELGVKFDDNARELFNTFARNCEPPLPDVDRANLVALTLKKIGSPTLSDGAILNCVKWFERRHKKAVERRNKKVIKAGLQADLLLNERYFPDDIIERIPNDKHCIILKAQKGIGKTHAIKKAIEYHQRKNPDKRIIFLTHRESFAKNAASRLGLACYSYDYQDNGQKFTRYAICIDSLSTKSKARLDVNHWENAIVIIDEIDQFIDHILTSDTAIKDRRVDVFSNLKQLLMLADRIYLASADVRSKDVNYIKKLAELNDDEVFTIINTFVIKKQAFFYESPELILSSIEQKIRENANKGEDKKKQMIMADAQKITSTKGTTNIAKYIKNKFPDLKILVIDKDTTHDPNNPAFLVMEHPELILEYDVVLISPSGFTALDFAFADQFDAVYGIFQGCVSIREIGQALWRLRDEKVDRHIFVVKNGRISHGGIDNPEDLYTVKKDVTVRTLQDLRKIDLKIQGLADSLLGLESDENFNPTATCTNEFCVRTAERNYEAKDYRNLAYEHLRADGYKLSPYQITDGEIEAIELESLPEKATYKHRREVKILSERLERQRKKLDEKIEKKSPEYLMGKHQEKIKTLTNKLNIKLENLGKETNPRKVEFLRKAINGLTSQLYSLFLMEESEITNPNNIKSIEKLENDIKTTQAELEQLQAIDENDLINKESARYPGEKVKRNKLKKFLPKVIKKLESLLEKQTEQDVKDRITNRISRHLTTLNEMNRSRKDAQKAIRRKIREELKQVREESIRIESIKVSNARDLSEIEAKLLEDQNIRTEQERLELRKYLIRQKFKTETITPELIEADDLGQYKALKRQYNLGLVYRYRGDDFNPLDFIENYDLGGKIDRAKEFYIPDVSRLKKSLEIENLMRLPYIPLMLNEDGNVDPDRVHSKESLAAAFEKIRGIFANEDIALHYRNSTGLNLTDDDTPVTFLRKVAARLNLRLELDKRATNGDGERVREYKLVQKYSGAATLFDHWDLETATKISKIEDEMATAELLAA